jgi:hypothetical protein
VLLDKSLMVIAGIVPTTIRQIGAGLLEVGYAEAGLMQEKGF